MIGLLGRKLGMTRVWKERRVIPTTVISVGPCFVVALKTQEKDGYAAIQLGYEEDKRPNKPRMGYFRKQGISPKKHLMEFRGVFDYKIGERLAVELFKEDERVDVSGTSKGKGFQGIVKRHGFSGGGATHGSMFGRVIGSIGQSSFPSRVWKNTGLPGRMGGCKVTIKNLKVVRVIAEKNLILIKGAVPGPLNGLVVIRKCK